MKIALIGRVANEEELYDGQTVKTRNFYSLLKKIDNVDNVVLVDTYEYKKHIFKVLFETVYVLFKCDKIVLSISINGRKFFFPFIYYLNKIFRKKIYHSLIGGRLVKNIETYPRWKKYVSSFEKNWVESEELVKELKELGIINAQYLPNFKHIYPVKKEKIKRHNGDIYSFCTFSRVQEKKGITDAIEAIEKLNEHFEKQLVTLDIYGPIDNSFKDQFYNRIKDKEYISYKGSVDSAYSVQTIKDYYALLFPTRYYNEGIPGTIIDAFAAGVPVIARKWHFCSEMIENGKNGIVYDFEKPEMLFESMRFAIENQDIIYQMKFECLNASKKYLFDTALRQISEEILDN